MHMQHRHSEVGLFEGWRAGYIAGRAAWLCTLICTLTVEHEGQRKVLSSRSMRGPRSLVAVGECIDATPMHFPINPLSFVHSAIGVQVLSVPMHFPIAPVPLVLLSGAAIAGRICDLITWRLGGHHNISSFNA